MAAIGGAAHLETEPVGVTRREHGVDLQNLTVGRNGQRRDTGNVLGLGRIRRVRLLEVFGVFGHLLDELGSTIDGL